MVMSQAAMSASPIGRPRLGVSATAAAKPSTSVSMAALAAILRVDMLHLPFDVDAPAGDAVVVLVREPERALERRLGLAALRDELGARRLHGAGLVPGAALQHRGTAVPFPRHAETGEGLGQHRRLQRSLG